MTALKQIRSALANLNPSEVRELADRSFTVGVLAGENGDYDRVLQFLLPPEASDLKAQRAFSHILRVQQEDDAFRCDFGIAEPPVRHPTHFYSLNDVVQRVCDRHEDLWIPVARHFIAFREPVIDRIITKICRENAFFAVATALPNVAPNLLQLPWAVGEFASDTAILTGNQIRMAFLIAAASDASTGYMEQRGQIGSIVASAFGWRAIARELVGKIPLGGGLVAKGLVAYAGTWVVGKGLERFLRIGRGLTKEEKREQYAHAYERGREVVEQIVARLRA